MSDHLDEGPSTFQTRASLFSGLSVAAQYEKSHANTPTTTDLQVNEEVDIVPALQTRGISNYRWYEIKPWARDLTPLMIRTYVSKLSNKKCMRTEVGKLTDAGGEQPLVAVASLDPVHAELVRDRLMQDVWKIYPEQKTALHDVNDYRQVEIDRAVEEWHNERMDVDRRKKERASVRMFTPSSVRRK